MKPALPIIALVLLALSPAADPLGAASVSSSFGVSATVEGGCVASATPGSFATPGDSAASGVRIGATPAISVNCTNPTAYSVGVSSASPQGRVVVVGNGTGASSALLNYVPVSAGSGKVDQETMVNPDATQAVWSIDLHKLSSQIKVDESATERVYPDTITVTITY